MDISLNQLKTLLNYTANGAFATSAEATRGTLQLGKDGKLENVGRHWFNTKQTVANAQQNLALRQALVETFRANNANEDFLVALRDRFGLDENLLSSGKTDAKGALISTKPLERREIKQIITAFEATRIKGFVGDYEVLEKPLANGQGGGNVGDDRLQESELDPDNPWAQEYLESKKRGESEQKPALQESSQKLSESNLDGDDPSVQEGYRELSDSELDPDNPWVQEYLESKKKCGESEQKLPEAESKIENPFGEDSLGDISADLAFYGAIGEPSGEELGELAFDSEKDGIAVYVEGDDDDLESLRDNVSDTVKSLEKAQAEDQEIEKRLNLDSNSEAAKAEREFEKLAEEWNKNPNIPH